MDLTDFVRCLVTEMYGEKNRFLALSKAEATSKLLEAASLVLAEMKTTTAVVV